MLNQSCTHVHSPVAGHNATIAANFPAAGTMYRKVRALPAGGRRGFMSLLAAVLFIVTAAPNLHARCTNSPEEPDECGEITPGRPKLWPIGDAHYLIGEVRHRLKDLKVAVPAKGLDPNATHIQELELLSRSFGIGVNYSQKDAANNKYEKEKFENQKQNALENQERLRKLDDEIALLKDELEETKGKKQAATADKELITKRRDEVKEEIKALPAADAGNGSPPPDPQASQAAEKQRAGLQMTKDQLEEELVTVTRKENELAGRETALTNRIDHREKLRTEVKNKAPFPASAPGVSDTDPPGDPEKGNAPAVNSLLNEPEIKTLVTGRIKQILESKPELHYSKVLNNLVEAHLQLLSRRLTLLKQSVDPNYDLFFMELSSSLAPTKAAKHHIARARWKIHPVTVDDIDYLAALDDLGCEKQEIVVNGAGEDAWYTAIATRARECAKDDSSYSGNRRLDWLENFSKDAKLPQPYIYEISPAQSALNIAKQYRRAKNFGLTGIAKTLFGLGISTSYQKQREQYGALAAQKVFAAGFGKGKTEFGWDFAPMAAENFVAPGSYSTSLLSKLAERSREGC